MRILFTALSKNIHTARWISQLYDLGWDIHIFGDNTGIHPTLRDVTIHKPLPRSESIVKDNVRVEYWWPFRRGEKILKNYLGQIGRRLLPDTPARLAKVIQYLQPDCIHTLKMQPYAYEVLEARKILGGKLPATWIYTSWGSDMYMYQHDPEHLTRIKAVLSAVDYYIADCQRDVAIAAELGFKGEVLGVYPGAGGFNLEKMAALRSPGPVSARRSIAVKGYQTNDGGQVLTALEAIRRASDLLQEYTIVIYGAIDTYGGKRYPEVKRLADEIAATGRLSIEFLPFVPVEKVWEMFGKSRISIAVSRSDGTPNTLLEAIVMGAYPIESNTGGPAEWITPGVNGEITPFDDPGEIAQAIRRALQDDTLVDHAAEVNTQLACQRLDLKAIQSQVIEMYQQVVERAHKS